MKIKTITLIILLVPFFVLAQENVSKKKAYYFYGEQCSHCRKVDEYFKANGIYDRYQITKLEITNPFNAKLLLKFEDVFSSPNKGTGSVPAIAFSDKFIEGDVPIIENFDREISAADAKELPDPEKIKNNAASAQASGKSVPSGGNKKYIFPVVLGALVIVGGGALVLINRKK